MLTRNACGALVVADADVALGMHRQTERQTDTALSLDIAVVTG